MTGIKKYAKMPLSNGVNGAFFDPKSTLSTFILTCSSDFSEIEPDERQPKVGKVTVLVF